MKLKRLFFILALVPVALLAFAFGANNVQKVDLDLLFFPVNNTEVGTGIALAFLIGAFLGLAIGVLPLLQKGNQVRSLEKRNAVQQKEILKLQESLIK